eukprot:09446_6
MSTSMFLGSTAIRERPLRNCLTSAALQHLICTKILSSKHGTTDFVATRYRKGWMLFGTKNIRHGLLVTFWKLKLSKMLL